VTVLEVKQLTVNYEKAPVLWDIDFEIPLGGHLVAIIGPNGAGKSTLLKALLGIVKPASGTVRFFGEAFETATRKIAYIPQRGDIDWDFPITAYEVVLMGGVDRNKWFGWPSRANREKARCMLQKVGMLSYADRQIARLSGGQQQRLFIARALMQEADLYLMDEPFVGVDAATEQDILSIFHELVSLGKTLIVVHHDLVTVERCFDWVVVLNTCLVAAGPVSTIFTPETLMRAYGRTSSLLNEAIRKGQQKQAGIP